MPAAAWGWEITAEELSAWILDRTPEWLVVNKPGYVVCHPSKHGPWSSLIGACRQYLGVARLHMPFRLDRETSGVVVLATDPKIGKRMQQAVQNRRVRKRYLAILHGELRKPFEAEGPIGQHPDSQIAMRRAVTTGGQDARTRFIPLAQGGGYTLVRVEPATGRLHQIRVHAAHIGHAVAGDKVYGPDEALYLEFVKRGFTERLSAELPFRRQALHCFEATFLPGRLWPEGLCFRAPVADDMVRFCREAMGIRWEPGWEED